MAIDKETGLTDKQKVFSDEYIIDLNGTQAAIRAGYSENTAQSIATENLSKPLIQEYIKILKAKRSEMTEITAQMVLNELAKIGFSNLQDYIKAGFKMEDIADMKKEHAAAIESISIDIIEMKDGATKTKVKLKLYDKNDALDKLGKHLGLYDKDNILNIRIEQPLLPDALADEKK